MVVVEVTGCAARRRELGACLRSYRRLITPAEVGLPHRGRRRTPGLRREEVAVLAGVGLSWYTWLEQGRVTASGQVLDAVGRVLGVDEAGRRHLRVLSAPADPPPAPPGPDASVFGPLLAAFTGPAVLLDHRLDIVAANPRWERIWGDPRDLGPVRRNVLWQLTADPRSRLALGEPEPLVRAVAREFRMAANLHAGEARIAEVVELLRAEAPAHAAVWDCRGVGAFGEPGVVVAGVPSRAHLLRPAGDSGSAVLVLAARPA